MANNPNDQAQGKPTILPPQPKAHSDADFAAEVSRRREDASPAHAELLGDKAIDDIGRRMPPLTEAQLAVREAERIERETEREQYARYDRWQTLVRERGDRYADCTLASFETETDAAKRAVAKLTDYRQTIGERIRSGQGVVLYGPKGTGKDHLAMALARVAIASGFQVVWQNGMDFFGRVRDAMDGGESERSMVSRLIAPDVLYLSDPLPPLGSLSEFQAAMLFRVLDGRYSRRRPTWATMNVSSGEEAEQRLGAQNVDRLRDEALTIHCNWPSHRRAAT